MRPRLVLWDIDGTLIDSARLGLDAFLEAFEAVVGRQPAQLVPFAGRTDLEIAHDMLAASEVAPSDQLLADFEEALVAAMATRLDELAERGHALPGTTEALVRVGAEPGVIQSLLTGNVQRNAALKLEPFGLGQHVEFGCGAYGSDHRVRGELVPIARERAERTHGLEIAASDVILIGDTPLDVAAAHEGGARAVGVATGPYDERDLHASGADAVLPDLSDTERVVAAILGDR